MHGVDESSTSGYEVQDMSFDQVVEQLMTDHERLLDAGKPPHL